MPSVTAGQAEYISETDSSNVSDELQLKAGEQLVEAHIPGSIWKIPVKAGDYVKAGDVVAIIESMKMEFTVTAAQSGIVDQVVAQVGHQVSAGQALMVLREKAA
jgi:urea carboxylase